MIGQARALEGRMVDRFRALKLIAACCAVLVLLALRPAWAAGSCQLISSDKPLVVPAQFAPEPLAENEVRLTFVGHSTFLIESPRGIRIATDYNDFVRPSVTPDIATMNRAHNTHYTDHPDPGIPHVLRGWDQGGQAARHDFRLEDVRVRNVPTNIRDWSGGTRLGGNSIFLFEVGGLCIAHLGHLHHKLTPEHLGDLGPVDIVLVPVDGGYTIDVDAMMEVLQAIKAPLILPMHYFSAVTLDRFLSRAREIYAIELSEIPTTVVSRATLPAPPKVLVLPGR
jgi:L-ascorbate metabolism protein UlaG (beta-lactamase superfamily)